MTTDVAIQDSPPITIGLLGPLEVRRGDERLDLTSELLQRLLVALVSAEGQPVPRDTLMEWMWDDLPDGAPDQFKKQVSNLRGWLKTEAGLTNVLISQNRMCRLKIPAESVDVHRFRTLVERVRRGDGHRKAELLNEARILWRGEPMAGIRGTRIDGYRGFLVKHRLAVVLDHIEIEIQSGGASSQISVLDAMFRDHPDNLRVAWLYMHALHRAGQPREVTKVFRMARTRLTDEYGLDVTVLEQLHHRMLNDDEGLLLPEAVSFPLAGQKRQQPNDETEDSGACTDDSSRGKPKRPADRRRGTSITAESIGNVQVFEKKVTIGGDWNVTAF